MKKLLKKKTLILVGGYPAAGKTYLSKKIAKQIACVYLDKDSIQDIFSTTRLDKKAKQAKPIVYDIIYKITEENLSNNLSVLIDAPFSLTKYMSNKKWVKMIKNLAKKHKAKIKVIWCIAYDDTRKKRILKRAADRDKERFNRLNDFILKNKYIGPQEKFPIPFNYFVFHTEKDPADKVIKFLEDRPI